MGKRQREKGESTKVACWACRKRKGKCDGVRPKCGTCKDRGADCLYEVDIGYTRTAFLRQKLDEATARLSDLELLVEALRAGSDGDSTMILAKLRVGDDVNSIIEALKGDKSEISSAGTRAGPEERHSDLSPINGEGDETPNWGFSSNL